MKTAALILSTPVVRPAASIIPSGETEAPSLKDWIERIRQAWSGSADQTLTLARLLLRVRCSLPYGSWNRLWQSGQVPFSKRKGEMLVVIGKCVEGMDAQNSAHLPAAWNTMYYVARLGGPTIARLIQERRIRPGLTLREAKALLAELHPERRARTRPSKLAVRLRRFSAWVRTECGHWSLAARALVQRRLRHLTAEISSPADILTVHVVKPLEEGSPVDSGQTHPIHE